MNTVPDSEDFGPFILRHPETDLGQHYCIGVGAISNPSNANDEVPYIDVDIESDPFGIGQHEPGAKLDAGKVRYSLIPTGPLRWLAKLYTIGAMKYSPQGWRSVADGEERYLDALMRHLEAYRHGEWLDKDSGVPHVIGVAWNAFAICWFVEKK